MIGDINRQIIHYTNNEKSKVKKMEIIGINTYVRKKVGGSRLVNIDLSQVLHIGQINKCPGLNGIRIEILETERTILIRYFKNLSNSITY